MTTSDRYDPEERVEPPVAADEIGTLRSFLNYYRVTVRTKCAGLDAGQLATTLEPSDLTLGGMLKHLTGVETWWFVEVFDGADAGEPWTSAEAEQDEDWDWHSAGEHSPSELLQMYDDAIARSESILEAALEANGPPALDALSARKSRREQVPFNLRWILVHLIEEYARHAGHADLIRESIDGSVGD
ncbi:MAG: DinB family protein [Nocardioides sp.]